LLEEISDARVLHVPSRQILPIASQETDRADCAVHNQDGGSARFQAHYIWHFLIHANQLTRNDRVLKGGAPALASTTRLEAMTGLKGFAIEIRGFYDDA